jgi:hypothetical protein
MVKGIRAYSSKVRRAIRRQNHKTLDIRKRRERRLDRIVNEIEEPITIRNATLEMDD